MMYLVHQIQSEYIMDVRACQRLYEIYKLQSKHIAGDILKNMILLVLKCICHDTTTSMTTASCLYPVLRNT